MLSANRTTTSNHALGGLERGYTLDAPAVVVEMTHDSGGREVIGGFGHGGGLVQHRAAVVANESAESATPVPYDVGLLDQQVEAAGEDLHVKVSACLDLDMAITSMRPDAVGPADDRGDPMRRKIEFHRRMNRRIRSLYRRVRSDVTAAEQHRDSPGEA